MAKRRRKKNPGLLSDVAMGLGWFELLSIGATLALGVMILGGAALGAASGGGGGESGS
jgi:hypothetical protein